MTNWLPDLPRTGAPLYVEIADAMQRDIDDGVLQPGEKLPPQRNLAFDIGVTIGTVGRAYALARERGLVTGEVGRGTYVRDASGALAISPVRQPLPGYAKTQREAAAETGALSDIAPDGSPIMPGKLRLDSTSAVEIGQAALIARHMSDIMAAYPTRTTDYIRSLKPEWQQAGANWLATGGWTPESSSIVPTLGVHAGMMAIIGAITSPGDKVVFEGLTYASIARAVSLIGRRPVAVPMADNGLDVDAFDHLCANQHPKALVVIPTIHNPTSAVMPAPERERLAAVARKHNVRIIEDNIYGARLDATPPPLAALAPEITFHLSGLSKAVAAGLRAGWVSCPSGFSGSVPVAHKMVTGGMPFLLAETAARMVLSGEADQVTREVRAETAARLELVRKLLEGYHFASHDNCPFIWLKLPEPWRSSLFVSAARDAGILIDGDDEFRFTQAAPSTHHVRIAFSTLPDRVALEGAITRLRRLLEAGPSGYDSYA
jgi:DNA-binding transcriptional MocR family regulator